MLRVADDVDVDVVDDLFLEACFGKTFEVVSSSVVQSVIEEFEVEFGLVIWNIFSLFLSISPLCIQFIYCPIYAGFHSPMIDLWPRNCHVSFDGLIQSCTYKLWMVVR